MIQIKIDCREHEIIRICKYLLDNVIHFKDLEIVIESLPVGDVVYYDTETKEEKVILERKSLQDLNSSIKDGRYEEQSFRLNGSSVHNHNIIYLIEGDMNHKNMFKQRLDKKMLFSAMFSLNHHKGFSVLRTFDIDETAFVICNFGYKLKKGIQEKKEGYYRNIILNKEPEEQSVEQPVESSEEKGEQPVEPSEQKEEKEETENYCHVVKKVKKENVTPENIGEIMLSQIPGISSVTAIAVMKEFKTVSQLMETLKKEGDACLKRVQYTNEKQQVKKLNKTVITNVMKYLQIQQI
jgi:ERCC4-type nuclease